MNFFIVFVFDVFNNFTHIIIIWFNINFQAKTHQPSITLKIFIFTVKCARFSTPEHAVKSLVDHISKLFNLLKLCQHQEWRNLTLLVKFLTSLPRNNVTMSVFVGRIKGKGKKWKWFKLGTYIQVN